MGKIVLLLKILVTEQKVKFYSNICHICEKSSCILGSVTKKEVPYATRKTFIPRYA